MIVLALSEAWIALAGVALGAIIGAFGGWAQYHWERDERSRAVRRQAYAEFLTKSEDSLHRFERLAKGQFSSAGSEQDRRTADFFYDDEVTIRYNVVKISGTPRVREAAKEMRRALNQLRHFFDHEELPLARTSKVDFDGKNTRYKELRNGFADIVLDELEPRGRRGRWSLAGKRDREDEELSDEPV